MLELTHVSKSFGSHPAVADMNLTVSAGEVVALTGPNGCGKTTTLRLCAGLLEADTGMVVLAGDNPSSAAGRRPLAYVPDVPGGLDELTIRETLDLYASLRSARDVARERQAILLEAFGLTNTGQRLGGLSNGQRRSVSIVAAASVPAPILLIDEATAALDPEAVLVLREIIRAHGQHGAVLIATQDLNFSESVATKIALLDHGHLLDVGTVDELCRTYNAASLEEAFILATGRETLMEDLRACLAVD